MLLKGNIINLIKITENSTLESNTITVNFNDESTK